MYLDMSRKQKALEEFSNIERTDSGTESSHVETLHVNFESSNDPSNSSLQLKFMKLFTTKYCIARFYTCT